MNIYFLVSFVLIGFASGGRLEFFRNTEKIFKDLAKEAREPLKQIEEALADGPLKAFEDSEDAVPGKDVDWERKGQELNKAVRDSYEKDLKGGLDNLDLKPVTNVLLDFLTATKDAINSIGWDAIPKAGNRIMNATVGAIGDILDNDKPAKLENHNATDCPFPTWIGDGVCDNDILIPACDYDGGDCCVETWYGDGYCDYANRHEKCGNFDGGDCDTKYPDCYKAKLIGNGECDEGNLEPE